MFTADMHCDTIYEIYNNNKKGISTSLRENELHVDLLKLKKADYILQNFAIYVSLYAQDNPFEEAIKMIDLYYSELMKNTDIIKPAFNYGDILTNQKEGKLSALLTIEEGGVCKGELSFLRILYSLGVRMMTLTWNYPNEIAFPNISLPPMKVENITVVPDFTTANTKEGLTEKGVEFVKEMERLGMIIDVSHLSDKGFDDVLNNTHKPFVASHSNGRAVCSSVRNLTDDMIKKLSERGGITGLNYCADFLNGEAVKNGQDISLEDIVKHARHIYKVGGADCLALGSDFDGIATNKELPSAGELPLLERALRKGGFSEEEIEKIFYKNIMRVYREVL